MLFECLKIILDPIKGEYLDLFWKVSVKPDISVSAWAELELENLAFFKLD